jgi:hypothetical protein
MSCTLWLERQSVNDFKNDSCEFSNRADLLTPEKNEIKKKRESVTWMCVTHVNDQQARVAFSQTLFQ